MGAEVTTKKCFKCEQVLEISEFYKHPRMADGHLGKCKECAKRDVRDDRRKKADQYAAYERQRYIDRPDRRAAIEEYRKTPRGKAMASRSHKKSKAKHPERIAANHALGNAVRDGRIVKPNTCSRCNEITASRRLHGHHEDYSKPLEVQWLCSGCHAIVEGRATVLITDPERR